MILTAMIDQKNQDPLDLFDQQIHPHQFLQEKHNLDPEFMIIDKAGYERIRLVFKNMQHILKDHE